MKREIIIKKIMIIILRNKRVIDKIKTETAVMKRVLSTVDSWCVTDGVRKEKERLTAACDSIVSRSIISRIMLLILHLLG